MEAEFKVLKEYPNFRIYPDGRIYDVARGKFRTPVTSRGYESVSGIKVHKLVALAFVDNPDPTTKTQVNHIDGVKSNNHYTNLEWCSGSENRQHAIDTGLTPHGQETKVTFPDGTVKIYPTRVSASKAIGIHPSTMARGVRKTNPWNHNGTLVEVADLGKKATTAVVWRNLRTGEEGRFDKVVDAAAATGLSIFTIQQRLAAPLELLFKDGLQFRREREFVGWVDVSAHLGIYERESWRKAKVGEVKLAVSRGEHPVYHGNEVLVKWLCTGEVVEYSSQNAAAEALEVTSGTMTTHLSKGDKQPVFKLDDRYALVKRKSDPNPWRTVDDPFVDWAKRMRGRPFLVTAVDTGKQRYFACMGDCVRELGISYNDVRRGLKQPNVEYCGYYFKEL
jgi:hypothetical protein